MKQDMTIKEFCDRHNACRGGREWAIKNCDSMQEAWEKAKPEWLIWIATRPGVLNKNTLRLFAVWSARQVQYLMQDARSTTALDVAEKHAAGNATDEELAAAWDAAWDAARAAERDAARDAAWDAAWAAEGAVAWAAAGAAARDAAWDAAGAAARDAARDAAWDAAGAAARDAAWDAARDAQAKYLRENTNPNFK